MRNRTRYMAQKSLKVLLFVSLLVIIFIYAMFQGGFVSWFLFYSFLPFALYGFLLLIYPLSRLKVERNINKRQEHSLIVSITIKRTLPFPLLFLMIEDVLPTHLAHYYGENACKIMVYPLFRRELSIQYTLDDLPRGEHVFQEIRIQTSDFLGFVNREHSYKQEDVYLVYPKIVEIKPRRLTSTFESGELNSPFPVHQENTLMSGIREYQPGDQFSWVDWKATARKDVLISKEFESKQTSSLCVLVDGMTSEAFEERVVFGASMLSAYQKIGVDIEFITVDTESIKHFRRDSKSFYEIMHQLARIQPDDEAHFSYALMDPLFQLERAGLAIVVTSTLTNELCTALQQKFNPNVNVIVFLVKEAGVTLNEEEKMVERKLTSYRYRILTIYEKNFADALIEVSRR
ncbi:DUF58 domain-containing protein [Metabacillus iocasae]|uniref:Uncharacterized protein (DUF58 family) n=1 Tax=Priestia iocasae TaxID=2291674 RepID=A0ABS2R1H4_9BACI|nr:DUF58 domain-containing protein [Metabacillus iocasae]MBM7705072.1 uncharacterized protein (DUF58 family) [Metabacillus iocasae]